MGKHNIKVLKGSFRYLGRKGTPGLLEPPLCRHEPPRFARQTEPLLCSNEHAQYIKMCLCNT